MGARVRWERWIASAVARLDGDVGVGVGAHGAAEVGLGQGCGVVDALADHRHDPAPAVQAT